MRISRAGAAAVTLLILAGCSSPLPGGEPPDDLPDEPSAITTAECLMERTWNLDVHDLGAQLGAHLDESGMPILSVVADGDMTLVFYADYVANSVGDVTFTIAIQPEESPLSTVVQRQWGSSVGNWAWSSPDSDLIFFTDWESDWAIEATMMVGGSSATVPFALPPTLTDGDEMVVSCVGDTLVTTTPDNPFIRTWMASGPA